MIRVLALLFLLTLPAAAQFATPRDLAFWGKRQSEVPWPTNYDGLIWWQNGDYGNVKDNFNTLITNDTVVTFWVNLASTGGFSQATGVNRYYVTNGLGYIRFATAPSNLDPNPHYMEPGFITNNQPMTIFMLIWMDQTNQVGGNVQFFMDSGFTFSANYNTTMGCVSNTFFVNYGADMLVGGTVQTNKWYYNTFVANGASSQLRVNSAQVASGNAGTNSLANLYLADYLFTGGSGQYLIGRIAEILIYDTAFSAAQINAIEGYLTNKYSLTP